MPFWRGSELKGRAIATDAIVIADMTDTAVLPAHSLKVLWNDRTTTAKKSKFLRPAEGLPAQSPECNTTPPEANILFVSIDRADQAISPAQTEKEDHGAAHPRH